MHVMKTEFGDGPYSPKAKPKWIRLTRMEFGTVELIKKGAKLVLGKRMKGKEECNLDRNEQSGVVKWGKTSVAFNQDETTGVPIHPR